MNTKFGLGETSPPARFSWSFVSGLFVVLKRLLLVYNASDCFCLHLKLYAMLRLYSNFFQPTTRPKSKERFGSRMKKSYHAPQTPYQRVLVSAEVTLADKKRLQRSVPAAQSDC